MGAKDGDRESCSSSDDQLQQQHFSEMASAQRRSISSSFTASAKRSTVALYSDELRLCIIEEVFKRPPLWDTSNREPASILIRKELYEDIAENLKGIDDSLTGIVVEKQWKNLKDTYNKVKKKNVIYDDNGEVVVPKWRFYNHMLFIDQDSNATADGEISHSFGNSSSLFNTRSSSSSGRRKMNGGSNNNNDNKVPNKMMRECNGEDDEEVGGLSSFDSEYARFWGIRFVEGDTDWCP